MMPPDLGRRKQKLEASAADDGVYLFFFAQIAQSEVDRAVLLYGIDADGHGHAGLSYGILPYQISEIIIERNRIVFPESPF